MGILAVGVWERERERERKYNTKNQISTYSNRLEGKKYYIIEWGRARMASFGIIGHQTFELTGNQRFTKWNNWDPN